MTYPIEKTLQPFWAQAEGYTGGRDPLGIQNSSVAVYSVLLPGLNNITDRLRYYGFYCWLLMYIEDHNLQFDSTQKFYNYLRRAEFTLALYMSHYNGSEVGIAGNYYAGLRLKATTGDTPWVVDVAHAADKIKGDDSSGKFWKYSGGILGQYYLGSLQNGYLGIGLIQQTEGRLKLTDEGRKLAGAYNKSISAAAAKVFTDTISSGIANINDLKVLADFSISGISPGMAEHIYYTGLFFDADFSKRPDVNSDTFYRRDTLKLLLDYLPHHKDANHSNFAPYIYASKGFIGTAKETPSSIGWFYYFACERMHLALEYVFSTLLQTIEPSPAKADVLANDFSTAATNTMCDYYYYELDGDDSLSKWLDILEEEEDVDYPDVMRELQAEDTGELMAYAIEYFLNTYKVVYEYREHFEKFTQSTGTKDKFGTALELMMFVEKRKEYSLKEFIRDVVLKVVNDHLYIAYNKMGNGKKQVLKFIMEDNYMVHINNIEPHFTGPRLRTASRFLQDMQLITLDDSKKYSLTNAGRELVSKL